MKQSKEQFIAQFKQRFNMTNEQFEQLGYTTEPCNCIGLGCPGWLMVYPKL